MCLARYKTRPGLTYHYNHSHKERDSEGYHLPEAEDPEPRSVDSPSAGSDSMEGPPRAVGGFPVYPGTSLAMEEDGRKVERAGGAGGFISGRPHYSHGQQMLARQAAVRKGGKAAVSFATLRFVAIKLPGALKTIPLFLLVSC